MSRGILTRATLSLSRGTAIALHFAVHHHMPVIINDRDRALFAFWWTVFNDSYRLIHMIKSKDIALGTWEWCREMLKQKERVDTLTLGFSVLFLNRSNFSGCLYAGPIGGRAQKRSWKITTRWNTEAIINRIEFLSRYRSLCTVRNEDAIDLLATEVRDTDILYLDPPYYNQDRKLYENYLTQDDHKRLSVALEHTCARWLMSYDECDEVRQLYQQYMIYTTELPYSFNQHIRKRELLITSDCLAGD